MLYKDNYLIFTYHIRERLKEMTMLLNSEHAHITNKKRLLEIESETKTLKIYLFIQYLFIGFFIAYALTKVVDIPNYISLPILNYVDGKFLFMLATGVLTCFIGDIISSYISNKNNK